MSHSRIDVIGRSGFEGGYWWGPSKPGHRSNAPVGRAVKMMAPRHPETTFTVRFRAPAGGDGIRGLGVHDPAVWREIRPWLCRFLDHGNGVAIVRAYTSSNWFHEHVVPRAETLCFPRGKTKFVRPDGSIGKEPGHGVVLIGMGEVANVAIERSELGFFVRVRSVSQAPYDGIDDFAKSLDEGYRAIRERIAAGGEGWTPK